MKTDKYPNSSWVSPTGLSFDQAIAADGVDWADENLISATDDSRRY
jgi:hypothetical protein